MQLSSNISQGESTSTIMNYVLLALIPGFASQVYFFGNAYLFNLGVALTANFMVCLAIAQSGSQGRLKDLIADNSNWLTCALIAIALPPGMPVWVIGGAVASGLGLGKYAYGGLGQNVFNPAMVGYAIVLISFPEHLALWPELIDGVTSALVVVDVLAAKPDQFHLVGGDQIWIRDTVKLEVGSLVVCLGA